MSEYTIEKGDTLSTLAKKYGYTVEELCAANKIKNPDHIQIGAKLIFPERTNNIEDNEYTLDKKDSIPEIKEYKIKKGDNLSTLAIKYGCTVEELCAANNITNPDKIQIGQTLIIPIKAQKTQETDKTNKPNTNNQAATKTYKVQKGDNLSTLAQKHGCTVEELCAANNITNPDKIQIGQTLVIPIKAQKTQETDKTNKLSKQTETTTSAKDPKITIEENIKKSEGNEPQTYIAPEGKATIGWGHQLTDVPPFLKEIHGKEISNSEKTRLLQEALKDPTKKAQLKKCIQNNLKKAIQTTSIQVSIEINDDLSLTPEQMDVLLKSDIKITENALKKRLGQNTYNNLSTEQKEALIDLFYNIGPNKKQKNGKEYNLITLIKAGNIEEAQKEFDFFTDEKGQIQGGLIRRNYQRMLKWKSPLTDAAKQKIVDFYNKCYKTHVKDISEIKERLDG